MLDNLYGWALRWKISSVALAEFRIILDVNPFIPEIVGSRGESEAQAQQKIRLEAPSQNAYFWRNNVGVLTDKRGVPVRYGLANDTKAVNERVKSSDLIGLSQITMTVSDVGKTFAVFTSIEVKKPGWKYTGTPREKAQLAWLKLIIRLGGFAKFACGPKDVWK